MLCIFQTVPASNSAEELIVPINGRASSSSGGGMAQLGEKRSEKEMARREAPPTDRPRRVENPQSAVSADEFTCFYLF